MCHNKTLSAALHLVCRVSGTNFNCYSYHDYLFARIFSHSLTINNNSQINNLNKITISFNIKNNISKARTVHANYCTC